MFTTLVLLTPLLVAPPCEVPDVRIVPGLPGHAYREPVQVLSRPGDENHLVIVERSGRVLLGPVHGGEDKVMMDLRTRVSTRNSEEGLLSIAFHPDWPSVRELFVYRSMKKPRRTVLSRFLAAADSDTIDPDSEEVLLEIGQPWGNHNGGTILFGPDRMLYLSIGDGGSAADPKGHGQDVSTLLGSIIRIDPLKKTADTPYSIPPDNPFVHQDGARNELWAIGLRNVWRMSFDSETGELWAGDVGQNAWEEVDIIVRGGNYGWNVMEGTHSFRGSSDSDDALVEPVIEYGRNLGGSVTGGVVYRGAEYPSMQGVYFYGDYMSGRVWGACRGPDGMVVTKEITTDRRYFPSSFGTGPDGSVYMCTFGAPYQRSGRIMKIEGASSPSSSK